MFYKYFSENKEALIETLKHSTNYLDSINHIIDFINNMHYALISNTNSSMQNKAIALILNTMVGSIKSGISIDSASVTKEYNTNKSKKEVIINNLPSITAIVVATYLFLDKKLWLAFVIAIITLLAFLINKTFSNDIKIQAVPQVNITKLINILSEMMSNADNDFQLILNYSTGIQAKIFWNNDELKALQMLIEANNQNDMAYSFKAVPQILCSLQNRGVRFENLSKENAKDFELFPGMDSMYTIRPAIYYNNELLAKGQAIISEVYYGK